MTASDFDILEDFNERFPENEGHERKRTKGRLDKYESARPSSPTSSKRSKRRLKKTVTNVLSKHTGAIRIHNQFYNITIHAFNTETDAYEIIIRDYIRSLEWAACFDDYTSSFHYIYQALIQNEHKVIIGFLNIEDSIPADAENFEHFDEEFYNNKRFVNQRILIRIYSKVKTKPKSNSHNRKNRRMSTHSVSSFDSLNAMSILSNQKPSEISLDLWPRSLSSNIEWIPKNCMAMNHSKPNYDLNHLTPTSIIGNTTEQETEINSLEESRNNINNIEHEYLIEATHDNPKNYSKTSNDIETSSKSSKRLKKASSVSTITTSASSEFADSRGIPLVYISPTQRTIFSINNRKSVKLYSNTQWNSDIHKFSIRIESDPSLHSLKIGFVDSHRPHIIDTSQSYHQNGKSLSFNKFDIITLIVDWSQKVGKQYILINGIPISSNIHLSKFAQPWIELKPRANISIVHDDHETLEGILIQFHEDETEIPMLIDCMYEMGKKKKCTIL